MCAAELFRLVDGLEGQGDFEEFLGVLAYGKNSLFSQDTRTSTWGTPGSRYRAVMAVPNGFPGSFCHANQVRIDKEYL